jgi:hypothetical protein
VNKNVNILNENTTVNKKFSKLFEEITSVYLKNYDINARDKKKLHFFTEATMYYPNIYGFLTT